MKNFGFRKGMKLKEALFWVIFAGVAAHVSLYLINYSTETFFDGSFDIITRTSANNLE